MIDVAVIGAGAISSSHLEGYLAFPDRCRIVAVVDIYPEKAARQVEKYGLDAAVHDDYRSILDSGVRLASVCTPPGTHAEIACGLLDAGINVLGEKPMAASLEQCDAMLAAEERSTALLSVVAQNRFRTDIQRLKAVLDSGLAGPVHHVQVESLWWRGHSYYDLWWRGTWQDEGGGPTLNHAVHHADLLRWLAGDPVEVRALMGNTAHDNAEVEDLSMALLRFSSGALGQLTSSVVHHGQQQRLVFQAEKAMVAVPWQVHASTSRPNGFPDPDPATERVLTAHHDAVPALPHEGHTAQIEDVLHALEDPAHQVLIDGRQGRGTVELITAIYAAAITGAPVPLPLAPTDPFYTTAGLLARAPRFHQKTTSVTEFTDNDITTTGG
jgi:predicted dehydrogenase